MRLLQPSWFRRRHCRASPRAKLGRHKSVTIQFFVTSWLDGNDKRGPVARRFRDLVHQVTQDLGGPEQLSENQRQIIRRIASMSVWCESGPFDLIIFDNVQALTSVFLVQDEIVGQIVARIGGGWGVIESSEAKSAARKSPEQIHAYDLVLRAREAMDPDWNKETFHSAKELLRQAIAFDPLNARALREMAWLAVLGRAFRFDDTPMTPQEIIAQANKAVQLDPADARARMVAASAYFYNGQLDLFEQEAQAAVASDPHDAEMLAHFEYMIAISGQWQRGVALAEKANALNADAAVGWYHTTRYLNSYMHGDYQRALELIRQDPGRQSAYLYVGYIPIYGELGRKQEALENWRKLLAEHFTGRAFPLGRALRGSDHYASAEGAGDKEELLGFRCLAMFSS